jgi:CRISPR-associated protein Cst2
MSYVTGLIVIDAPASALNNAGADTEARTENAVAVKFIRAPEGRYPYVSAQAVRYWLRTQLSQEQGWTASPVFRETKVAYTDAEPTLYMEDDLFGYMRAASKSTDEKKAAKRAEIAAASTPVDSDVGEVTRISPFRVGTLVAVASTRIVGDFGTMARAEGDPVPHEHQFYRAHLKAGIALDLTCAGTFFVSQRVGYKNLDSKRIENAKSKGATDDKKVRNFTAWRLPIAERQRRTSMLIKALGRLDGGAKQTLHLTDTAPSILVLAICKSGNQPFQRLLAASDLGNTEFRLDVLEEAIRVFGDDLISDIHVGWARGFLDAERKKLETALTKENNKFTFNGKRVYLAHPREIADTFAKALLDAKNASWFE